MRPKPTRNSAFTIIELLVVISIISLLIAILLPSLAGARDRARYIKWKGYSHSLRVDQRMVGYWNFEEQGEGDVLWNRAAGNAFEQAKEDIEPEMYNGDITGPDPNARWIDGRWKGKGALEFPGVNSGEWVNIGEHEAFRMSEDKRNFSIGAWFKVRWFTPTWQTLFSKGDQSWRLHRYQNTDYMTVGMGCCGVPACCGIDTAGTKNVKDGRWHFMFFSWEQLAFVEGNRGASNGRRFQYMDGKIEHNTTETGYIDVPNYQYDVLIGHNDQTNPREWDGQIDEVMFFHGIVDSEQVAEMYRVGAVRDKSK